MYQIRTTRPSNNKYYMRDDEGGYNTCILGKPTISDANVLCNCVGYAEGRFNEICNELGGGIYPYKYLNCNAENFIQRVNEYYPNLEISDIPTPAGIMVWEGLGSLAGHVAIVEYINENGTIFTSESAYNGSAFYNATRSNSNGRWGMNSNYKFLGCIKNPAYNPQPEPTPTPQPEPTPEPVEPTFAVGDIVVPINLVDYNGTKLVQWDENYKIIELVGDRAVLQARGAVWAAMNTKDIKKA